MKYKRYIDFGLINSRLDIVTNYDDLMSDELFTTKQCPNCSGYGSKGKPPYRVVCPTCKGTGIIVIDNMTGKLIVNDDDENKNSMD